MRSCIKLPENPFLLEGISVFFALVGNLEIIPALAVSSCLLTAVQCPNRAGVCVCTCVRACMSVCACVLHERVDFVDTVFFIKGWLCVKTLQFFYPHFQYPYTESPLFLCHSLYSFCFRFLLSYVSVCFACLYMFTTCMPDAQESAEPPCGYLHSFLHVSNTVPILRQSAVFLNVFTLLVLLFKT